MLHILLACCALRPSESRGVDEDAAARDEGAVAPSAVVLQLPGAAEGATSSATDTAEALGQALGPAAAAAQLLLEAAAKCAELGISRSELRAHLEAHSPPQPGEPGGAAAWADELVKMRTGQSSAPQPRPAPSAQAPTGGCVIPETALRGITIPQLEAICKEFAAQCAVKGWTSIEGQLLTPETFNLYDLVKYYIKPMTEERNCSLVELVASGPQPPAWFVSHWWGEPVEAFIACLKQHREDRGLAEHTVYWVRAPGARARTSGRWHACWRARAGWRADGCAAASVCS